MAPPEPDPRFRLQLPTFTPASWADMIDVLRELERWANTLPLNPRTNYAYYGDTTGERAPWNQPWGLVGYAAQTSTSQTGISSEADITSVSLTVTTVVNRYLWAVADFRCIQRTSAGINEGKITTSTNTLLGKSSVGLSIDQTYQHKIFTPLLTSAAGANTFKLRTSTTAGTTDTTVASNQPAQLFVFDVGPAATAAPVA